MPMIRMSERRQLALQGDRADRRGQGADDQLAVAADVEHPRPERDGDRQAREVRGIVATSVSVIGRIASAMSFSLPDWIAVRIRPGSPSAPVSIAPYADATPPMAPPMAPTGSVAESARDARSPSRTITTAPNSSAVMTDREDGDDRATEQAAHAARCGSCGDAAAERRPAHQQAEVLVGRVSPARMPTIPPSNITAMRSPTASTSSSSVLTIRIAAPASAARPGAGGCTRSSRRRGRGSAGPRPPA